MKNEKHELTNSLIREIDQLMDARIRNRRFIGTRSAIIRLAESRGFTEEDLVHAGVMERKPNRC